jgi:AraC family transcriptional regulator, activator of mtrCDE
MDVLSHLIFLLDIRGRLDLRCEFGEAWRADHGALAAGNTPYHIVMSGQCCLELPGGAEHRVLNAGDILVLPRGTAHVLRNVDDGRPKDRAPAIEQREEGAVRVKRNVGDGERPDVEILCGFFEFNAERHSFLIDSLPDYFVVPTASGPELENLRSLVQLMSHEALRSRIGAQAIINELSTALFAMVLRAYLETQALPSGALALLTSTPMRSALQAILEEPGRDWKVSDLARLAHMSRATFARAFTRLSGATPMAMLTQLRMERAAVLLRGGQATVGAVAEQVGYQSEAAFNRAFTRHAGIGPGSYRRDSAAP